MLIKFALDIISNEDIFEIVQPYLFQELPIKFQDLNTNEEFSIYKTQHV